MTIFISKIGPGTWLQAKYDELAKMSVDAGVSVQETRDAAVLNARLRRAIDDARMVDVIPFPGVKLDA